MIDPKHVKRVEAWYKADKEKDLRFNYSLDENSIVFDLGAYDCRWAKEIYSRYNCNVYAYEPVKFAFNMGMNNISNCKKIYLFNYGLGKEEKKSDIYINKDGSSFHNKSKKIEKVDIFPINKIIRQNNLNFIDLMKLNIEGDEYDVLDLMIDDGMISMVDNYQIQFHRDIDNYKQRRNRIVRALRRTHNQTFCFDYVWEGWKLK